MPPTPLPVPTTAAGFLVLDLDLPDCVLLAEAGGYEVCTCSRGQGKFYDQLDANGEGGSRVRLALTLAPVDATRTIGPGLLLGPSSTGCEAQG